MKLPKLKKVMTERERAEKLVYVISEMMAKKPTAKNIKQTTDYLEGRFDMGSDIDDALLFKVEKKLKGNLPILRRTMTNPVRQQVLDNLPSLRCPHVLFLRDADACVVDKQVFYGVVQYINGII